MVFDTFSGTQTLCRPDKYGNTTLLRHKAGQEGRGEILLENSFMQ